MFVKNYHLERFDPLHGKMFMLNGLRYKIYYRSSIAIYPYRHRVITLDVENLDSSNEFSFMSLDNPINMEIFERKLEKMLANKE